jgi:hypothetical protein
MDGHDQSRIGGVGPAAIAIAHFPVMKRSGACRKAQSQIPSPNFFLLLSLPLTRLVHDDAEKLFQTGCRRSSMALTFHDFAS